MVIYLYIVSCGSRNLDIRHSHRSAQKFKDYRDRGRRGHTYGIKEVQQENIGYHYCHEDDHQLVEHEFTRVKDAFSRYFHHATGKNGPDSDSKACDYQNSPKSNSFGTYRRVQKVYRIITNPHY